MSTKKIKIGDTVHGYAGGLFGRDSYNDKTVVQIGKSDGVKWAVLSGYSVSLAKPTLYLIQGEELQEAAEYLSPED